MKGGLRRILGWLGWACAGLLLLLALVVTLARQFLPAVAEYREPLAGLLSDQLGVPVDIGTLEADWSGRWPRLRLTDLRTFADTEAGPEVRTRIGRLEFELDLLQSLLNRFPIVDQARMDGLEVVWRQHDGRWLHRPGEGEGGSGLRPEAWNRILGLIMLQPQLRIRDTRLTLLPEQGAMRQVGASELLLQNSRTEHQLSGSLELPEAGDAGALRFAVETREVPADPLTADYDFYLDLDRLGPELLNLDYLPLRIEALSFDTEFWGRFSGGSLEYLQGGLALAQLRTDDPRLPTVEAGRTGFALLRRNDGYQLQLNDLVFASAGATLELDQLVLDSSWRDGRPRARALSGPVFDLAKVGQWLQVQPFVSEPLRATIERLAPQGAMRNLRLNLPPSGDPGEFSLAGDLERVSVEAAWGAPRISGISGRLEADRQGGRLHLDSEAFELFFPELYDQGWQYDRANGLVRWSLQPDQAVIGSELLHLGNPSVSAAGRFSLALPYDRAIQTELTLMIGMVDSDGLQTANYVPPEQVGRALHRWLGEAIGGGRLQRGGLVLRTGTRSLDEGREPTVQMFFDVDDAGLAYQPGWPGIDDGQVFVLLRDRELLVEVEGGRLLDSVIEHARVYLPGPGAPLQVSGRVAGGAGDIRRLLLESPLRSLVGEALSPWQLDGSARTDVRLSIPLGGQQPPAVEVASRLEAGRMVSNELRLEFSSLEGELFYSTARGLRSEGLSGSLFGLPVSALIRTPEVEPLRTRIELSGSMPVATLADWSDVTLLDSLTGRAAYNARLDLCAEGEDCNRLVVVSDLKGVAVPWPTPLGKPGQESRPLTVTLDLNSSRLRFNYDQRLRAVFGLDGPLRGRLTFGGERPALPGDAGLWLDGRIETLEAEQVQALLESQGWLGEPRGDAEGASAAKSDPVPLRELDLEIGALNVGGNRFEQLRVQLAPSPWRLAVSNPQLDGRLEWPAGSGQPYRLLLERLQLPRPEGSGKAEAAPPQDDPEPIDIGSLPPVDIRIASLRLGDEAFGSWQLGLRPAGSRMRFEGLEGRVGGLSIRGEGVWQEQPASTELTLRLQGDDLGDLLSAWGNGRVLESERAEGYLQLAWPQRPWNFALARSRGELQFALEDGRIIDSGSASNVLRLFGILNLNSLARRLKLDFSDLLQSGLAFDRLSGRYGLERGVARTLEPLRLEGPSANMTMTGQLDVVAETVNQEMEVTLPLTSNIPLAAILLGAPQVAGAVFLIDKLIGDKLEKVTTIRYQLSGDWDEPEVSIIRAAPPAGRGSQEER